MTRTRVVIQSRLSSSRLPGKALMTVGGMPLIELVARRAARTGHEVVVATSIEGYDDRIARRCQAVGIDVVRGSLDDVLSRFVLATEDLAPEDRVVRLTGDNPFADAALVDELLAAVDASGHTYGRVDIERVPEGLGAEVFTAEALRLAHANTDDAYDREHVTPWLRREFGELLFVPRSSPADIHAYRATVDTLHDFVRVSTVLDEVDDPVAVPWQDLMDQVVARVDALGPRVPLLGDGPDAALLLSARRFDDEEHGLAPAERAEALRALVTTALDRGVHHVEGAGSDGASLEMLRACTDPAVVHRFRMVLRVGLDGGPARPRPTHLAAAVERDLARYGRRRVDILVLADRVDDDSWALARSYRDAGVADRLGLVAADGDALEDATRRDGLAYVEVAHGVRPTASVVETLRARGVVLATDPGGEPLPDWATVRILASTQLADLDRAVAGLYPG